MSIEVIGREMVQQHNRHTQYPLFVVTEYGRTSLKAGVFFTEKAAQDHINQNLHHYRAPGIFVESAWRNPEMVAVMQHLIREAGEKVPQQYL